MGYQMDYSAICNQQPLPIAFCFWKIFLFKVKDGCFPNPMSPANGNK